MGIITNKPNFDKLITSKKQSILNKCKHKLSIYNRFLNFFTRKSACFDCQKKYQNELSIINDFEKIFFFIQEQKYLKVEFGTNLKDALKFKKNDFKITINSNQNLELQLYSLLHEIGHYKIESRKIKPNIVEAKKFCQQHNLKPIRNTTETIADEICAWNQGELLFKSLNVNIPNNDKYQKFKFESLLTYF